MQSVSFQNIVLPYNNIGKSLYTFLKGGYIPEVLLSNTNSNKRGGNLQFQEIDIGIHRLPYETIDNYFVNFCLKIEEMHFIIAQVSKIWSRYINKEFFERINCR